MTATPTWLYPIELMSDVPYAGWHWVNSAYVCRAHGREECADCMAYIAWTEEKRLDEVRRWTPPPSSPRPVSSPQTSTGAQSLHQQPVPPRSGTREVLCGNCGRKVQVPNRGVWTCPHCKRTSGTMFGKNEDPKRVHAPISTTGDRSSGALACPKCGGTQFKAKRSKGAKALLIPTVGMGALLAKKSRVKCVTCGTEYMRG